MTFEPDRNTGATRRTTINDPAGSAAGDVGAVRNTTEARQGSTSGRVRWVLVLGIVFVVIAFLAAYLGTRP